MSLSISGVPANPSDFAHNDPPPVPTPTLSQQAYTLASSGHSIDQIAVALAIPVEQVNNSLGIKTGGTSAVEASNLSVHV